MDEPRGRSANMDMARTFLRWTFCRAVFHRGYVIVSSLYFVTVAHLSASQLVLLGLAVSATLLLSDIPTGVLSDTVSRKWPLVAGHCFMAGGMLMTGLVTAFPLLIVTQVLWGLGWGCSSGADVAWLSDEIDDPDRTDRVLTARARFDLLGSAAGMIGFGILGWATSLGTAVVASGVAMCAVGMYVAVRFVEDRFTPSRVQRLRVSVAIFRRGIELARRDREIVVVLAATLLINGASKVTWLFPKQLLHLGFPADADLWYTGLIVLAFLVGAMALRFVERRIHGIGVARRTYVISSLIGASGLLVLAFATNAIVGGVGVLLAYGVSFNVTRAVSVVWVNRRATSDVRATAHSFLGQAEYVGEVVAGSGLAAIASTAGLTATIATCAALAGLAALLVVVSRADRPLIVSS